MSWLKGKLITILGFLLGLLALVAQHLHYSNKSKAQANQRLRDDLKTERSIRSTARQRNKDLERLNEQHRQETKDEQDTAHNDARHGFNNHWKP